MSKRFGKEATHLRREVRQAVRGLAQRGLVDGTSQQAFLDIGFSPDEVARLLADADTRIDLELSSIGATCLAGRARAIEVDIDDLAPEE